MNKSVSSSVGERQPSNTSPGRRSRKRRHAASRCQCLSPM